LVAGTLAAAAAAAQKDLNGILLLVIALLLMTLWRPRQSHAAACTVSTDALY